MQMHFSMFGRTAVGLSTLLLAGCASFSSDGGFGDVSSLTQNRVGQAVHFTKGRSDNNPQVQALLGKPLSVDAAVQIALLNSPALKTSFAELGVAEADFVQAGRMRNPSFTFGRVSGGGDAEIDRSVMFDIAGLLTLPVRTNIEKRRFEQVKLLTAARAVQLASETRRAYFTAV